MWENIVEVVKNNPFSQPLHRVSCESRKTISQISDDKTRLALDDYHSIKYGSLKFYLFCCLGGMISSSITHTLLTPLDVVKCRMQVDAVKYPHVLKGVQVTLAEEGILGLTKGWAPTLLGYGLQGSMKFGFYEVFKKVYSDLLSEEHAYMWRTAVYLAASATAEVIADVGLCPFEAVKVRIQTHADFPPSLHAGAPIIFREEGVHGFVKGLVPLWVRQVPYTMMKFTLFERILEALYKYAVPKARSECSKVEQLVVTFSAGYIAGIFCAVVSHPADTVVSKLNQMEGSSAAEVAKALGFHGMWKGLAVRIFMIGTLNGIQWFIYDAVKVWLDLPRPPPPEMPESMKRKMEK